MRCFTPFQLLLWWFTTGAGLISNTHNKRKNINFKFAHREKLIS
jgi:hypothetical protein